jgi:hypothetical protein
LDQATVLPIAWNSIGRKYEEWAHMACVNKPVSQASQKISPTGIPFASEEVNKLEGSLV